MTTKINQPVNVTAVLFNSRFDTLPRRIEFDGRTLTFGKNDIESYESEGYRLFNLRSGRKTYRLRHDEKRWTLLEIFRT